MNHFIHDGKILFYSFEYSNFIFVLEGFSFQMENSKLAAIFVWRSKMSVHFLLVSNTSVENCEKSADDPFEDNVSFSLSAPGMLSLFLAFSSFIVTCVSMTGLLCSYPPWSTKTSLHLCKELFISVFHRSGNVWINVQVYRNLRHM